MLRFANQRFLGLWRFSHPTDQQAEPPRHLEGWRQHSVLWRRHPGQRLVQHACQSARQNANLLGKVGNHVIYYFRRVLGVATANDWSRRYFGSNSHFPWIADPQDFPARVKVLYNAVGGSELARFPDDERQLALNKLAQAAYLSFRDNETQRLCTTAAAHNRLHVAPDSAVLMSEQYPLARLRTLITPALTGQLANQRYVCFHANYNFVKQNLHTLTQLLEALYREHRLTTVLLPIGRYVGLDDQIGLRALQQQLETRAAATA